jgi:uncharacterized membrane protein YphA (DoxX/SURF4 family)
VRTGRDLPARAAIASVWLEEGLLRKVIGVDRSQLELVQAAAPAWVGSPRRALRLIGAAETALALWVLSGRCRRGAAGVQTAVLVGMNATALLRARQRVDSPAKMLAGNATLLCLAWRICEA